MWTKEDFMLDGEPMLIEDIVELVNSNITKPRRIEIIPSNTLERLDYDISQRVVQEGTTSPPRLLVLGFNTFDEVLRILGITELYTLNTVLGPVPIQVEHGDPDYYQLVW